MTEEWRDIDSAPKDGTRILAAREGLSHRVEIVAFDPNPRAREKWKIGSQYGRSAWEPTHWMPLPEMPGRNLAKETDRQDG